MIKYRRNKDQITPDIVNELRAALDLPPVVDINRLSWWADIVIVAGVTVADIHYPTADEWNAAVDFANNLIATKETA